LFDGTGDKADVKRHENRAKVKREKHALSKAEGEKVSTWNPASSCYPV